MDSSQFCNLQNVSFDDLLGIGVNQFGAKRFLEYRKRNPLISLADLDKIPQLYPEDKRLMLKYGRLPVQFSANVAISIFPYSRIKKFNSGFAIAYPKGSQYIPSLKVFFPESLEKYISWIERLISKISIPLDWVGFYGTFFAVLASNPIITFLTPTIFLLSKVVDRIRFIRIK